MADEAAPEIDLDAIEDYGGCCSGCHCGCVVDEARRLRAQVARSRPASRPVIAHVVTCLDAGEIVAVTADARAALEALRQLDVSS